MKSGTCPASAGGCPEGLSQLLFPHLNAIHKCIHNQREPFFLLVQRASYPFYEMLAPPYSLILSLLYLLRLLVVHL